MSVQIYFLIPNSNIISSYAHPFSFVTLKKIILGYYNKHLHITNRKDTKNINARIKNINANRNAKNAWQRS